MAILANESGGSSILLETNNLLRIVALVDNTQEERAKMVSEMWSVLFYLCKSEVLALKMLSIVKIERIRKGKTFTRFFTYTFSNTAPVVKNFPDDKIVGLVCLFHLNYDLISFQALDLITNQSAMLVPVSANHFWMPFSALTRILIGLSFSTKVTKKSLKVCVLTSMTFWLTPACRVSVAITVSNFCFEIFCVEEVAD